MVIMQNIRLAVAIATAVAIAALLAALLLTRATLASEHNKFELWKTAVAHAQAEAKATALEQKALKEANDAKAAHAAQSDYDALRERYAGLVRAQTARSSGSDPALSRGADAAPVSAQGADDPRFPFEGGGVPAGTILIPQTDALICAENTAYAQAAHDWALRISASAPQD